MTLKDENHPTLNLCFNCFPPVECRI